LTDPITIHDIAAAGDITVAVCGDLKRRGLRGWALSPQPRKRGGTAVVSSHLPPNGPKFLEAAVHEVMHLQRPNATEATVERDAHQLATLLWRIGFRLPAKD